MVYITEVLVFLAVLISVTVSRATYGPRRPTKYLPPKRTYNPVKEVVKKTVLPKKGSTLPIRDRIGALLPEELPAGGGFFTRDRRDPLLRRDDGLNRRRGLITDNDRPWLQGRDIDQRVPRRRTIPSDLLGLRGDSLVDRRGLPSSDDFLGLGNSDLWLDRESPSGRWADRPRSRTRLSDSRSSLGGLIDPRDVVGRDQIGLIGDGLLEQETIPRRTGLTNLNPALTDRLRSRVRNVVSGRPERGFRSRDPLSSSFRERQLW